MSLYNEYIESEKALEKAEKIKNTCHRKLVDKIIDGLKSINRKLKPWETLWFGSYYKNEIKEDFLTVRQLYASADGEEVNDIIYIPIKEIEQDLFIPEHWLFYSDKEKEREEKEKFEEYKKLKKRFEKDDK